MVKKSSLPKITVFHIIFVFITALLLCLPVPAYAGADAPPPEPKADIPTEIPEDAIMIQYGTPVDMLPTRFYTVTFLHDLRKSESAFTMRVAQYGTIAGCAQLQFGDGPVGQANPFEGQTTKKYVSDRLDIKLDLPVIANKDYDPRYTNYDCETSHLQAYVDIDLDRDVLLERNIKKFSFEANELELGNYDIDLNKDRLIFKSKPLEDTEETWLTLWFFPRGTLKLYVPEAKSDMNVVQEIRDFAVAKGLVPMEDVREKYTLPHTANDYAYFVDTKMTYLKDLLEDNGKQIGTVGVPKTYYGPGGPQEVIKQLPVHASIVFDRKVWK